MPLTDMRGEPVVEMSDLRLIEPQPRKGKPFRIAFQNRGPEYWYNENADWPRCNRMLHEWKCPFGVNGEPVLVDGKWYWQETSPVAISAEGSEGRTTAFVNDFHDR